MAIAQDCLAVSPLAGIDQANPSGHRIAWDWVVRYRPTPHVRRPL